MPMFRKKPVVIEAIQLSPDTWAEICWFMTSDAFAGGVYLDQDGHPRAQGCPSNTIGLWIQTEEGTILAHQGDWIIKDTTGEFYACKDEIFRLTYEPVDPDVSAKEPLPFDDDAGDAPTDGDVKLPPDTNTESPF